MLRRSMYSQSLPMFECAQWIAFLPFLYATIDNAFNSICHLTPHKKWFHFIFATQHDASWRFCVLSSRLAHIHKIRKNRMWTINNDLCTIRRECSECSLQRAVGIYRLIISEFLSISIPIKGRASPCLWLKILTANYMATNWRTIARLWIQSIGIARCFFDLKWGMYYV